MLSLTVYLSTTSVLAICGNCGMGAAGFGSSPDLLCRSIEYFPSAAVISWPLWNLTPWRSLKMYVLSSGADHSVASAGTICSFLSQATSESYITSFASCPVASRTPNTPRQFGSALMAQMTLPPVFGVPAAGAAVGAVVGAGVGAGAAVVAVAAAGAVVGAAGAVVGADAVVGVGVAAGAQAAIT